MLERLKEWRERFYDCIVPRKVYDAPELGEWVHRQRALCRRGRLPPAAVAALDGLGFAWEVDVPTAKWYHNLHAARHYREVHGTGEVPEDLHCPEQPDWVEAGRWLARQRVLYRRQKLLLLRVRLLKEALGIKLAREYSRPRRHLHPVLEAGNAQFKEQLRQRAAERGEAVEERQEAQGKPRQRRQQRQKRQPGPSPQRRQRRQQQQQQAALPEGE